MGMPTVKAIVGGITSDLPSLKSFEGLHKVETLNGLRGLVGIVQGAVEVEVSDNKFLVTLTGLERVTTIGKNLQTMPVLSKAPNEVGSSSSGCFSRSVMDALALGTVPAPFLMSALGSFPVDLTLERVRNLTKGIGIETKLAVEVKGCRA
jgi:hypothetical protein